MGVIYEVWQGQGPAQGEDGTPRDGLFQLCRNSGGYPFKCLENEHWIEYVVDRSGASPPEYVFTDHPASTCIQIDRDSTQGMEALIIPIRPIWLGLALNTAIYTGMILVARALFLEARASRRRRRGSCTNCGYRLVDPILVCPECGKGTK